MAFLLSGGSHAFAQNGNADLIMFEQSIEAGRFAEIERDVLNYAIKNPKEAKAFELLGRIRFRQNRLTEARALFEKSLTIDPELVTAKIKLGETLYESGDPAAAKTVLTEVAEKRITDDRTRLDLAEAFRRIGDCSAATVQAEKLSPEFMDREALALRAGCLIKLGERTQLGKLMPSIKKLDKKHSPIALEIAGILLDAAMPTEAADLLGTVIAKDPADVRALIMSAKAAVMSGDLKSAGDMISRAGKLAPDAAELLFVRGLFEAGTGNPTDAVGLFEKYLSSNPDSIEALRHLTLTAIRSNQSVKAFEASEKLLRLKPGDPEFFYLHGAASLQSGRLADAERSLRRFLELAPDDSLGCLALGLTYAAQSEKLELARTQLRRCIELDPDNYEAKYQLGLSHKTQGEIEPAIVYLEAVVQQKADYAGAWRDLGTLYLQTGAEQKARIALEKASVLDASDADTHFQLSRLYNLIGETELAKKHLKIFQDLRNPKKGSM
jgi:tetratricopeptide (TPR) repeat protein